MREVRPDTVGLGGVLYFFERPDNMSVEYFQSHSGEGHLALVVENLATNNLFNYVLGNMGGIPTDLTVRGLGLGFGTIPPANNDSTLSQEWQISGIPKRYPVTLFIASPSTGAATFSFFIPSSDTPSSAFTEAGLFCGTIGGDISYLATHSSFVYNKGPVTDVRVDYTLSRI